MSTENTTINIYQATITKKDGTERVMRFIYLKDIPQDRIPQRTTDRVVRLSEGMERVYDIENKGYRTINKNTIKDIQQFTFNIDSIEIFPSI